MESADATLLFGPRGSLDTASDTGLLCCCNCGTLDADSARCMAAAEGWVDSVEVNVGVLSFRSGDVLREVRGLCPAEGDAAAWASAVEDGFLSVDVEPPDDDAPDDEGDLLVPFFAPLFAPLLAFVFAPLPVGSAVSACPLSERKSAMLSLLLVIVVRV